MPETRERRIFSSGPKDPRGKFGFWLNQKEYDPDRVDLTMQVNATEDWVLTSSGEPHIYHIHVNPFEIMDVTHEGKSIFGPKGECLVLPDSKGLENQYCRLWHTFKDTVFVQNDYQVHMRTTYDRYIGEFVIHCHILDHEDSGMMANVLIVPDVTAAGGGLGMPGMEAMSNGTMALERHKQ
jgi:FtsP/CotA-like multicopper oxidase with cupredoxin domain